MLTGVYTVGGVVVESHCRTSKDYELSEIGDYKIHSTTLMPDIEFGEAIELPSTIDDSILINDEETKPQLAKTTDTQNYLTTKYIGRAPLEYYGPKTVLGREFSLICKNGKTFYDHRAFGTEDAIAGYNKNANEATLVPKE